MCAIVEQREIPEEMQDMAEIWRHDIIERIAELDDELTELYLEDESAITEAQLKAALRRATIEMRAFPTYCGSALKNIGVQRVLNGVIEYLPNPAEVPDVQGTNPKDEDEKLSRPNSEDAPFSGLVFKVVSDSHGDLTYVRVYSGRLEKGSRGLSDTTVPTPTTIASTHPRSSCTSCWLSCELIQGDSPSAVSIQPSIV